MDQFPFIQLVRACPFAVRVLPGADAVTGGEEPDVPRAPLGACLHDPARCEGELPWWNVLGIQEGGELVDRSGACLTLVGETLSEFAAIVIALGLEVVGPVAREAGDAGHGLTPQY